MPSRALTIAALLASSAAFGADPGQLALSVNAQTEFDRVALSATPQLRDTSACILAQSALVPVAPPEEQPLVHFRKGFCTLAQANITGDAAAYKDAAGEFDRAIQVWPARLAVLAKKRQPPESVSSGLRILAQIARLENHSAATDAAARELETAVDRHDCPAGVMSTQLCERLIAVGRQWQGWLALRDGNLEAAARDFQSTPGWSPWVAGLEAFRRRQYAEAAADDQRAVADWDAAHRQSPLPLFTGIAPPVDLSDAHTGLGGAQLLAGNPAAAIASLTEAARESPANARAFYLRARAHEAAGNVELAQTDYSLASRTAFAYAQDLSSGEAHLYRGIYLYRRRQFAQAEDEFSSALNFDISTALRPDASAWRRLAAVAEGSCGASRAALEQALPMVSPYFPKDEARAAMAACTAASERQ